MSWHRWKTIIFIQHPGEKRWDCLWQEAIGLGTRAALKAWWVNIEAYIFSTPAGELRSIIWNYRLRDKSWTWKTGWDLCRAEAGNSKAKLVSVSFLGNGVLTLPLSVYTHFFFPSPWARFIASLCTSQKILPHNSHMCKFFQLKYLIKIKVLSVDPKFPPPKVSDWPRCPLCLKSVVVSKR